MRYQKGGKLVLMKLPKYNVELTVSRHLLAPEAVKGMICYSIFAGGGHYHAIMRDEEGVRAVFRAIIEDGPEQFLVNMPYIMIASTPGLSNG
jgi:hypothetical protein